MEYPMERDSMGEVKVPSHAYYGAQTARALVENSLALATVLVPKVGYDRAAEIAKEAFQRGETVGRICLEKGLFSPRELERILDPWRMTEPGFPADDSGEEHPQKGEGDDGSWGDPEAS